MRIWHESLIPKLCQKHLCAMWREGLGAYKIITENKKGYRNHPATKEFENAPYHLLRRLYLVRVEMLERGYNPKELPCNPPSDGITHANYKYFHEATPVPWQTLEEQIEVLKGKGCACKLH